MFMFWHIEGTRLRGIDYKDGLYFVRVEGGYKIRI
jgi:hypothetical protein